MRTAKTYDFIIVLKQANALRVINWASKLLLFTALLALVYQASINIARNEPIQQQSLYFLFSFIIIAWWAYCFLQEQRGAASFYRFALMIAAWGWYIHPHTHLLSLLYLAAAAVEKPLKIHPEYAFDSEMIILNSFPQKQYDWNEINNIVLKDGLLTIDLKNNKLIQKEVNDEVLPSDEHDFNEFCRQRLSIKN